MKRPAREFTTETRRHEGCNVSRSARLLAVAALSLLLGGPPRAARADDTQERDFIWREASAKIAAAQSADDYLSAAQTYLELADRGVRNGVLFYDLGTALLKAHRYQAATHFLRRAERYRGSSPELRRNLLLAARKGQADESITLPWYRTLLLWHFGLPCATRSSIAVGAFALFWLALGVGRFGWRPTTRAVATGAAVLVALFGSSVLTSLHHEMQDRGQPVHLAETIQPAGAPEEGATATEGEVAP